jgi:hypothetical protein
MPVEIKNLTQRPVLMRLNSGATLHLSPGMSSDAVAEEDVDRNEKVQKLQSKHVIALTEVKGKGQKGAKPQVDSKSPKRKK